MLPEEFTPLLVEKQPEANAESLQKASEFCIDCISNFQKTAVGPNAGVIYNLSKYGFDHLYLVLAVTPDYKIDFHIHKQVSH